MRISSPRLTKPQIGGNAKEHPVRSRFLDNHKGVIVSRKSTRALIGTVVIALLVSMLHLAAAPPAAEAATLVHTVQAESLTTSGSTSKDSTKATFYSNNDSAYSTLTFAQAGRYTITAQGASSASSTAGISVYISSVKVAALSFTGTALTASSAVFDVSPAGAMEVRLRLETDTGANDTIVDSYSIFYEGPTPPLPPAPVPPSQGAFASGNYRNLFQEWNSSLTSSDITAKLNTYWTSFFTGTDDTKRLYYPAGTNANGAMAYVKDTGNNDVRSEGMSYGMMIAVQMDKKAEFDAMWNWAKSNMQHKAGARSGYFCWQANFTGSCVDNNPASDGEEYFATALLFAGNRWGNGTGIYDYTTEGNAILNTMLHKEDMNGGVVDSITNMFNRTNKMIVFVPFASAANFSDPSYHLPAFYEFWGRWATGYDGNQAADRQFWLEAAERSRQYFVQATNATTGLNPDYAEFSGAPNNTGNHGDFRFDAWRTSVNWAVDYAWWADDPNQKVLTDRLQSFFESKGMTGYVNQYSLSGSPLSTDRSPGLIASNAAASLSATNQRAWKFVEELWKLQPSTGQYRYYDGLLNFMALLHSSGNFRIYGAAPQTPDTVAPSVPTALASPSKTSTSVGLSWAASTDNQGVASYTVRANGAGAAGCTAVTATSCTVTGLLANTSYSFWVTATDAADNTSAASTALTVVTSAAPPAGAPAAPSALTATAATATSVTLGWTDNASNETGFNIERKTGPTGTWSQIATTGSNVATYTSTALTSGTQYFYRVRATNATADSAYSNEANATPAAESTANRNPASIIEAESFNLGNNVSIASGDSGTVVNFAGNGSYIKLTGVMFGSTAVTSVELRVQEPSAGDSIQISIGSPNNSSNCTIYPDGNNTWHLKSNTCYPTFSGTQDVYIKSTGPLTLNYVSFLPHRTA